jgi:hypothetical protein
MVVPRVKYLLGGFSVAFIITVMITKAAWNLNNKISKGFI